MRFKTAATVVVMSRGKRVFTFPHEYIWLVPENQRKIHPAGLESRARMMQDLDAKRLADQHILSNQEYRDVIERMIPNFSKLSGPMSSYIGFFLPGYEDRTITLEQE